LSTEHNPSGGAHGAYETRDANPSSLVHFAVGLALMLVLVWAGMWWLLGYFGRIQSLGPPATPFELQQASRLPPLPRLQVDPVEDLYQVRAQQRGALDSYGWVDRSQGIVHIPIARAMELILERGGLPARPNAQEGSGAGAAATGSATHPKTARAKGAP
jgi:hypothetical protein